MEERELLGLAAKAVGMNADEAMWHPRAGFVWVKRVDGIRKENAWNPLTDDGDALRLAVKLKLHIGLESHTVSAWESDKFGNFQTEVLSHRGDEAATRRAIVRAAAEVGKAMP